MEIVCKTIEDNVKAADELLKTFPEERIYAFYGKMGAGKTTFIKTLCSVLGVDDIAKSPTFAIINEYEISQRPTTNNSMTNNDDKIYHLDCYRLKGEEEAYDIGYEEYLYSGNYVFIEWPERIENLLPLKYLRVDIDVRDDETRILKIEPMS